MKKVILFVAILACLAAAAGAGYYAGINAGGEDETVSSGYEVCFYAVIEEVHESYLLVKGLDVNDINHRGEFTLSIGEGLTVLSRGEEIEQDSLTEGLSIAVYYDGEVMDSYPMQISGVTRISVLSDELYEGEAEYTNVVVQTALEAEGGDVTMTVEAGMEGTLDITIENNTDGTIQLGRDFGIYVLSEGEYAVLEVNVAVTLEIILLSPGESIVLTNDIGDMYESGGEYRVIKSIYIDNEGYSLSVDFSMP